MLVHVSKLEIALIFCNVTIQCDFLQGTFNIEKKKMKNSSLKENDLLDTFLLSDIHILY